MTFDDVTLEWTDRVEILLEELEGAADDGGLTREQIAVLDVAETSGLLLEGDGLHDFWQSGVDKQRVINSFDLIGASAMVDVLNASQWCQTRNEDRGSYTETESSHLATIEEDLYEALVDLPALLDEFVEDELE